MAGERGERENVRRWLEKIHRETYEMNAAT